MFFILPVSQCILRVFSRFRSYGEVECNQNKIERMMNMKKAILIPMMMALVVFGLSACALTNDFAVFERTLDRGIETADQLDKIAAEDLSETNVTGLDFVVEDEIVQLSYQEELAVPQIVQDIRALHQAIRVAHAEIVLIREDNRIAREELRAAIELFRESDMTLSEEDKATLKAYVDELRSIRDALVETNGEAFQKMKSLRGQYRLENAEMIQTTLQEVLGLLESRKAHFERVGEIIAAVQAMAELQTSPTTDLA